MNRRVLISAGFVSAVWISVPLTVAGYELDLSRGTFPDGVVCVDADALPLNEKAYKVGSTTAGWLVERFGNHGYVALSPTCTVADGMQDNRMSLPPVAVEEGCFLRWSAASVHPDFPDSYKVAVTAGSADAVTVYETGSAPSRWTTETVDLSGFAGKEVTVTFVATGIGGYMLAVGDVSVGAPSDVVFEVTDLTPRYVGFAEGDVPVRGEIRNVGAAMPFVAITCRAGDVTVASVSLDGGLDTGASFTYDFTVKPELNASTHYYICGVDADGNETVLHDDSFFCSHFRRTLFVDKGTGMWCNNCPQGNLELETLTERYGDAVIAAETHVATGDNDPLAQPEYWAELKFYGAPYFKLNRNTATAYSDISKFDAEYKALTTWWIQFDRFETAPDGSLSVAVKVMSAFDADNSADRYRVGYLLTRDYDCEPEGMTFYQSNKLNSPAGARYYFLPKKVPSELLKFHNVTLRSEKAFSGIENSIPPEVDGYEPYTAEWSVALPVGADGFDGVKVVAYVLDTETGRIMNAAAMTASEWDNVASLSPGVTDAVSGCSVDIAPDGTCVVDFGTACGDYSIEISDIGGRILYRESGSIDGAPAARSLSLPRGVVIARITTGGMVAAGKYIIY